MLLKINTNNHYLVDSSLFHLNAETKGGSHDRAGNFDFISVWTGLRLENQIWDQVSESTSELSINWMREWFWLKLQPKTIPLLNFFVRKYFSPFEKKTSNEFTQHERSINDRNDIHERSAMWSRASLSAGYTRNEWKIFDQPSQLSFVRDQRRSHMRLQLYSRSRNHAGKKKTSLEAFADISSARKTVKCCITFAKPDVFARFFSLFYFRLWNFSKSDIFERLLRVRIAGGTIAEVKTNQFLWSLAESS